MTLPFLKKINIVFIALFFCEVITLLFLRAQLAFQEADLTYGDQLYYLNEVKKLDELGFYAVLSEGTSIVYSYIVLSLSYCFDTNFLIMGKLMNFGFIILTALVIYRIMKNIFKIDILFSILIALVYIYSFEYYSYKMLSDISNNLFIVSGIYLFFISFKETYRSNYFLIFSAILFGLSMGVRPTSFLFILAFVLSIIVNKISWEKQGIFVMIIVSVFLIFQAPSLIEKGTISVENKNKIWLENTKIDKKVTWHQINTYFVLFPHIHQKKSKFKVDRNDVNEYVQKNPGSLPESSLKLLLSYPKVWLKHFVINWKSTNGIYFSVFGFNLIWGTFISNIISYLLMPFLLIYFVLKLKKRSFVTRISFWMISFYTAFIIFIQFALIEANWLHIVIPFFLAIIYKELDRFKFTVPWKTGIIVVNCFTCFLTIKYVWFLL